MMPPPPPQAQQGTAQAAAEPETDFSRAFAADDPPFDVYDVTDVFGPGRRPIPKIAIQQPRVKDQGHAIAAAHKTLEDCSDAVKSDPDALDNEKLAKELGDLLWYLAAIATANGLTLEEIATMVSRDGKPRIDRGGARPGPGKLLPP